MKKKTKRQAQKDSSYYTRLIMKIACETKCRTTYDICFGELGIGSADELIAKAKKMGVV